jgi:two-component system, response regulator YesN
MAEYKALIEKICKFAFSFTNISTMFIDSSSNIQLEIGHIQLPVHLEPYLPKVTELLNLNDYGSEQNVLIHLTSYMTNFISVKICSGNEYIGSIVVGPYLTEDPKILMIENIIFENKLSISLKNVLKQYYLSLPLISSYKAKLLAEAISYSTLNLQAMTTHNINIGEKKYSSSIEHYLSPDTVRINTEHPINLVEKIYAAENEFLHMIETGNTEKLLKAIEETDTLSRGFLNRIPNDPLRSQKNLFIVLNTLARKAAERGGLHPMYVHSLSEKYAIQIERVTSFQQFWELYKKMILDYSNAVRKLSIKNFSYLTQKAIEYIRKNLDGDLSLVSISNAIGVNLYGLSRQFKKETGHSIIEYINIQRVNEAVYLMENQKISITDIAYMIGYNDITYFTKVFRKLKGMPPSMYRKTHK